MTAPIIPDDRARLVSLTVGKMENGSPYWCYIAIKPSRYGEFTALIKAGNYNMQNFVDDGFGEVIVSGTGMTPPTDVTKQVAKMFNVPIKELMKETDGKVALEKALEKVDTKS
jgi:hypothetical protein